MLLRDEARRLMALEAQQVSICRCAAASYRMIADREVVHGHALSRIPDLDPEINPHGAALAGGSGFRFCSEGRRHGAGYEGAELPRSNQSDLIRPSSRGRGSPIGVSREGSVPGGGPLGAEPALAVDADVAMKIVGRDLSIMFALA
jgi:hypothetical protein